MMVKTPRKPTKKETEQLINLLLEKDTTGFEERKNIAEKISWACIAVFDVDAEKPELHSKEMIVIWPTSLEITQAFFWEKEELHEVQINP